MKTFGLSVVCFLLCFFALTSVNEAQDIGFTYSERVYMSIISGGFYVLLKALENFSISK